MGNLVTVALILAFLQRHRHGLPLTPRPRTHPHLLAIDIRDLQERHAAADISRRYRHGLCVAISLGWRALQVNFRCLELHLRAHQQLPVQVI